jgi:hypothetical protein
MALDVWPLSTFPVGQLKWWAEDGATSAGPGLAGPGQWISFSGGFWWNCALDDSMITTADEAKAWRAAIMQLDGGAVAFEVPFLDFPQTTTPTVGKLHAAAALRATALQIDVTAGRAPVAGDVMTLVHATQGARLYGIQRVTGIVGSTYSVNVRPALREASLINDATDFANPRCTMQLAPGKDGAEWPAPTDAWVAKTGIKFVETFAPLS